LKLPVIFESDTIIAFSKPSGLRSIPDRFNAELPCLHRLAEAQYGKLYIVHRLDKDTSGVICFAKDEATHKYLSALFQGRDIEKYYWAIVAGKPMQQKGSIEQPIAEHPTQKGKMVVFKKGKPSHTDYKVLKTWNGYSLLELQIHTGRTHQIRVHLEYLGTPVLCDPLYGSPLPLLLSSIKKKYKLSMKEMEEKPLLNRLALHAHRITFTSPEGEVITIEAPIPKDFDASIKQLDKWS
jgi:23S rRNA pseudouridine1911/1915/1917 synthase